MTQQTQEQDGQQEQEQVQRKTSVFTFTDERQILKSWRYTAYEEAKEALDSQLEILFFDTFKDHRQYSMQVSEIVHKIDNELDMLYSELRASVLLVHAADCQIGEMCINADLKFAEGYLTQTKFETPQGQWWEFKRLTDGSGWQRIA